MNQRVLGRTGLRVSEVGFGGAPAGLTNYIEAWNAGGDSEAQSVVAALHRALDLGINYLDTAPGYGDGTSERLFGQVIERRRDECIVATKAPIHGPDAILKSVERSLANLRCGIIDVLQFHGGWYPPGDVDAILNGGGLDAFRRFRDEGKVRFLGFTAEGPSPGVSRLIATGEFDVLQVRFNLMHQSACDFVNEEGIIRDAKALDMGIVTMRSLTSGTFQRLMRDAFPVLAGADLDGFLLGYNLSNPLLDVVLVGMRRVEEVEQNVAVASDPGRRIDLERLHQRYV